MSRMLLLISATAADRIAAGGRYGRITCKVSDATGFAAVTSVGTESNVVLPTSLPDRHWLTSATPRSTGHWYRVEPQLHAAWWSCRIRTDASITFDHFARQIPAGLIRGQHLAVTWAPDVGTAFPGVPIPQWAAWLVHPDGVIPLDTAVEDPRWGIEQLKPSWPVDTLADVTATVVGTGSIGATAAVQLATYGLGRLLLVDPDRLLWHNLVRHIGSARDVGRYKVAALKDQLNDLRPGIEVEAHELDVVTDADQVRALLTRTDIVLCAADGVAPRRVVSHLARRAEVDAILACVLDDGAVGELLRLRPVPTHGCLLCQRRELIDAGALDPEPTLDADYGSGTRHIPMTAVGGDLHLVGDLAAKAAIATVLERRGSYDQRLPGERALIGLRPQPNRPTPFDAEYAGTVRWDGPWPSRPDCPTCGSTR